MLNITKFKTIMLLVSTGLDSPVVIEEEKAAPADEEPAGALKFHVKPPSQVSVPMNGRLELFCDVSGAPPPAVYWLKNGQPIPEVRKKLCSGRSSRAVY